MLNVKQIALKMEGEGPKRLNLSKTGPGAVTAGDISVTPAYARASIEVLNKSLVICNLDEPGRLRRSRRRESGSMLVAP